MPAPSLPSLRLPGATWTRLITDRVDYWLERLDELGREVQQGDTFPGELPLKERERLAAFLAPPELGGTDPMDFEMILNLDYYDLVAQKIAPPPVSPRWFNALSTEQTFRGMQKDFRYLLQKYAESG